MHCFVVCTFALDRSLRKDEHEYNKLLYCNNSQLGQHTSPNDLFNDDLKLNSDFNFAEKVVIFTNFYSANEQREQLYSIFANTIFSMSAACAVVDNEPLPIECNDTAENKILQLITKLIDVPYE